MKADTPRGTGARGADPQDSDPEPAATGGRRPRMGAIERAHLKDPDDASHTMARYEASLEFAGFLRWFWIPVWSVPPGSEAPQHVLQYPTCLIVIALEYSRFYGVVPGLSTTVLTGTGWAMGLACAPAAGRLITGHSVAAHTDRFVDLAEVIGPDGERLAAQVRATMDPDPDPSSTTAHRHGMVLVEDALRRFLPVDAEGELINRVVAFVEDRPDVLRVAQVCAQFQLTERSLQRLVRRRLGLTPKWLIQRRRLQEAAERLRRHPAGLAEVAAELGYADQPHFSRDFAAATSMTPGEFAARHAH